MKILMKDVSADIGNKHLRDVSPLRYHTGNPPASILYPFPLNIINGMFRLT
jgi:hypothetical protein